MNVYIVRVLVLSILRKNAHLPLLIALTPPVLLATVLLSLPSMSGVVEFLDIRNISIVVVLDKPTLGNCYSARTVEVVFPLSELSTTALVVNHTVFNSISTTISAKPINNIIEENTFASLPKDLYYRLGEPAKIKLRVRGVFTDVVQVKYVHELINAPIIVSSIEMAPHVYVCITDKQSVLRDIFLNMEESFFAHVHAWVAFLVTSYIPLVYVASRIVTKSMGNEFRTLINLGLNPSRLVFCASLSLLAVTFLLTAFLYSLSIVVLYTTYSFVSTITPIMSPRPGIQGILLVVLLSVLCYPLFITSVKRSIPFEG